MTTPHDVRAACDGILDEVEKAVVGKRESLELVLLGLLADGHVLIEDYPGLAKTLVARSFAQVAAMSFSRIQFTPDLMPSDVTGSSIYNQRASDFEFRPGPIFTQPPPRRRDQPRPAEDAGGAARGDAGAAGDDRRARPTRSSAPFLVLATQNPIEYEGTYPLPEAQLDRFLLRDRRSATRTRDDEWTVLSRRGRAQAGRRRAGRGRRPRRRCSRCSARSRHVHVSEPVGLLHGRRRRGDARQPAHRGRREPARVARAASSSPAAARRSRAATTSTPDDVKAIAGAGARPPPDMLKPELWVQRLRPDVDRAPRCLEPCRRRRPRTRSRSVAMTRSASPRLGIYAGFAAARVPARPRAGPSRAWLRLAAPFAAFLVLASGARRALAGADGPR